MSKHGIVVRAVGNNDVAGWILGLQRGPHLAVVEVFLDQFVFPMMAFRFKHSGGREQVLSGYGVGQVEVEGQLTDVERIALAGHHVGGASENHFRLRPTALLDKRGEAVVGVGSVKLSLVQQLACDGIEAVDKQSAVEIGGTTGAEVGGVVLDQHAAVNGPG